MPIRDMTVATRYSVRFQMPIVLLIGLITLLAGCGGGSGGGDRYASLTIIQTSDVHHHAAGFGPSSDYTPLDTGDNDSVAGGYARIAAVVRAIRDQQSKQGVPVLLVDSGDFLMGTIYDLTYNDPLALKFMSELKYDAVTLGNHEFDWGPGALAELIVSGIDHGFDVPIVASNLVFSPSDPADDSLEQLMSDNVIVQTKCIALPNGINVGILGVMGSDADRKSPAAAPCAFDHDDAVLQEQIDRLKRQQNADLILLLSHSGVAPDGSGEDWDLSQHVHGIDMIASGHEHIATSSALVSDENQTIIFSPGEYGKTICRLDLTYNVTRGTVSDCAFSLISIDDPVGGSADIAQMVSHHRASIDTALAPLGLTTRDVISRTDFPLELIPLKETALGNIAADAMRASANRTLSGDDEVFFQLGVVASGMIRDYLYPGSSGLIRFEDIFNVLPMGDGPVADGLPGNALMSIYVKSKDIKNICEVAVSLAPLVDSDVYLNFSGIRFTYDASAFPFNRVRDIYLCSPGDPYTETAVRKLDTADTRTLHRIAVNQYAFELMAYTTFFGLPIIPLDQNAEVIDPDDREAHYIDASQTEEGLQRFPQWMALYEFLRLHFPADGKGIPQSLYGENGRAMGRVAPIGPE